MQGATDHKASMQTRLEYMEGLLGDSADKHSKATDELAALQAAMNDKHAAASGDQAAMSAQLAQLQSQLSLCAKSEHHASLEQRLEYLERLLGESADKHEKEVAQHEKDLAAHKGAL